MSYTSVSWSTGDLITATKLGNMTDNDAYFYKRYDQLVWSYIPEITANDGSWAEKFAGVLYLPHGDRDQLTVYCLLKITGSGTGYLRVEIGSSTYSDTMSTTGTSYAQKTGTIDVSGASAGANLVQIDMYTDATSVEVCSLIVLVSPE